jgi:hypothetical protein
MNANKSIRATLAHATLAAVMLVPAAAWAQLQVPQLSLSSQQAQQQAQQQRGQQQQQRHLKRNAVNQAVNGVNLNLTIASNALSSPILRNPEGLEPILSLGPLPQSNNSPQFESNLIYISDNFQINQNIIQNTSQYINMQENMAGGNGVPGTAQTGNGSSTVTRGTNASGLRNQRQRHHSQQNEGEGTFSNPAQGEGQTP